MPTEDGYNRFMNMRKIFKSIICAAMVICAAGCSKTPTQTPALRGDLVGEWHLSQIEYNDNILNTYSDVYIAFHSDCTFELFQKSGDQTRYTKFCGTCNFDGKTLSGTYNDGTPWGSAYQVSLSGDTLTLTNDTLTETQTYTKEAISENIRNNADIKVKSTDNDIIPIL